MAIVIAGERSGVGKTTVTLALLAALKHRLKPVQSFKVGPDYIDPMFHQHITQRPCRNLDPLLTSEQYVQQCYKQHTQDVEYALVEGVMGLYDGASGTQEMASTAHVARLLKAPIVLVIDCSRLSRSVAAIAHGYRSFDSGLHFAGVVLNRVGSDRHLELLTSALEPLGLPVLGVLRRQEAIAIPDRHLGLVPTAELTGLDRLIDRLAQLGEACFNWSALLPLMHPLPVPHSIQNTYSAPALDLLTRDFLTRDLLTRSAHIAVARDRAFSFYYPDNLDLLETLGARLIPWSPLTDLSLPPNIQGLYLGGGFPEMFAPELSANKPMRIAMQQAIQSGMPVYAECGGLMYLCETLVDFEQHAWPMVGIVPTQVTMTDRLTLGYRRAIAQQDTPLIAAGQEITGHEFRRSWLTHAPRSPLYRINRYDPDEILYGEGWHIQNVHASYLHVHWGTCPQWPARFIAQCAQFGVSSP
jgi:cobyrinic acid a,c-diamide synthase